MRRLLTGEPTLDTTFGTSNGGRVFDYEPASSYLQSYGYAVAAGANGTLFIAGDAADNSGSGGRVEVAKLTASGALDTTFGGGDGVATFSVPGIGPSSFKGITVQSDGKILAVGYDKFVLGQMLVVRFNADGSLDTSFDGDGYRTYGNSGPDTAYVAKQLPSGRILIGGSYEDFYRSDMGVLRLNADGSPDTTYGGGDGAANFDFYAGNDFLYDMVPLADGSVVGVGSSFASGRTGSAPAIVKYTAAGALDTTFAEAGASEFYTRLGVGSFYSVKLLSSGKFLASGFVNNQPAVARFTANGLLDTTFGGGDGWASVTTGSFLSYVKPHLVANSDGSMLVDVGVSGPTVDLPGLVRFSADGVLDTAFGTSGVYKFGTPGNADADLNDMTFDSAGRLVTVGNSFGDVIVSRLNMPVVTPGITATLSAGTLTVTGTGGSDTVTVRNDFAGNLLVETVTQSFSFAYNAVTKINVDLGVGNDKLTVKQVVGKPMTVAGGTGDDTLDVETSNGDDTDASLTATHILGGSNDVTFDASLEMVQLHTLAGYDQIAIDLSGAATGATTTAFLIDGGSGNDTYNLLKRVGNGATLALSDTVGTETLNIAPVAATAIVNTANRSVTFTDSTGFVDVGVSLDTITGLNGPRVTSTASEYETAQAVTLNFDNLDTASLALTDLVVRNLNTGAFYTGSVLNAGNNTLHQSASWRSFAVTGTTTPVTLPDGNYRATIPIGAVKDVLGNTNPTAISVDFYVLAGDANRDRKVDFADLVTLAQNYNASGKTFSQGNFDYSTDGVVNFADLVILAQRYGKTMDPVASLMAGAAPIPAATKSSSKRVAAAPAGLTELA